MQTRRSSHRRREHTARSSARLALALTLAGPACAGDFGPIEEHRDPFLADVYLVNDTHADVTVWLHRLDPERALDCEELGAQPHLLLAMPVFLPAEAVTLPPGSTVAARDMDAAPRDCHAVFVQEDSRPRAVLFWFTDQIDADWVEGTIDAPAAHRPGAVLLTVDGAGAPSFASVGPELVFVEGAPE